MSPSNALAPQMHSCALMADKSKPNISYVMQTNFGDETRRPKIFQTLDVLDHLLLRRTDVELT